MAKTIKHGLGRGLGALLGDDENQPDLPEAPLQAAAPDSVVEIRLTDIDPNREQPRRLFREDAMRELSDSIRSVGVIQPILVRRAGNRYQIIAGERRWRAARFAGLQTIPAIVRDWDEVRRLEVALIENLQRDDLNPVEEALGTQRLMEQCGYTQEAVSQRLGRSRPAVANSLRLLTLPESVKEMLRDGRLSAGHARALVGLKDAEKQVKLANLCVAQGWSVRQLERICAGQADEPARKAEKRPPREPEFQELERMARDAFGTRAVVEGDRERGKLVLSYFSREDLQRIWDVLDFLGQGNL